MSKVEKFMLKKNYYKQTILSILKCVKLYEIGLIEYTDNEIYTIVSKRKMQIKLFSFYKSLNYI